MYLILIMYACLISCYLINKSKCHSLAYFNLHWTCVVILHKYSLYYIACYNKNDRTLYPDKIERYSCFDIIAPPTNCRYRIHQVRSCRETERRCGRHRRHRGYFGEGGGCERHGRHSLQTWLKWSWALHRHGSSLVRLAVPSGRTCRHFYS